MRKNTSHNGYLLDGFPRDARHGLKFEESVGICNNISSNIIHLLLLLFFCF